MIRILTTIIAAVMLAAGAAQAQPRATQTETIQLSSQMIEALQQGRVEQARTLLDAARGDEPAQSRSPMRAGQALEFFCSGHRCLCEGADDCVDLAGTGICPPGSMDCDARGCTCDRPQVQR
ncbi:MAG: hypothetical protein KIS81_00835 [Maricaulaceae bacterium]|nr:hypothetical protein [Maricaulaceae bacterium]